MPCRRANGKRSWTSCVRFEGGRLKPAPPSHSKRGFRIQYSVSGVGQALSPANPGRSEIGMKDLTRRDMFKTSLAVPAAVAVAAETAIAEGAQAQSAPPATAVQGAGRERLLLDSGWRFHFGHATDLAQDFNFRGNFSKSGNFGPVGTLLFDDADWKSVDLPHDWAIELPFQNDPALSSKGFYPLGRAYPATSIGWYRRVLELPASDAGKRIT